MASLHTALGRRKLLLGGGAAAVAGGGGINAAAPHVLPEHSVFSPNDSHWSLALPPPNPPPVRDLRADILIIGGGFTGLSAGYYIRQKLPHADVVVLEAARCGNGASGRNGAMLLTCTANTYLRPDPDAVLDRRLYDLTTDNIARIGRLAVQTGVDCELEQSGALQVANTREDARIMASTAIAARRAGLPVSFWRPEELSRAIGTAQFHGALFEPGSGQIHPGKLVALWKRSAEMMGVKIFEGAPVVAVEEGETISLTLTSGVMVRARTLVLATNAYTSKLGYLRGVTAPIVNYVAMTAPLTPAQLAGTGWSRRIPFNDSRVNVSYAGMTRDGRIHIGGGVEDYLFNNGLATPPGRDRAVEYLRAELVRLYPSLSGIGFERSWWGFVDMTADETPAVGRTGRHGNILYALGLSGHGVNLTSVLGRIIGDLASEDEAGWRWFPYLARLPPYIPNEPFRWLGVQGMVGLLSE